MVSISIMLQLNFNLGNDQQIYLDLADNPLATLIGNSEYTQYPVLLGLLLLPISILKRFDIPPEVCVQIYFSILGLLACNLIDRITLKTTNEKRKIVHITMIPWIFLVCNVFVQEDIIGILAILLTMIAIRKGSMMLSLFILSIGIVFAKLFFVFLLFPTLLFVCIRQKRFLVPLIVSFPGVLIFFIGAVGSFIKNQNGFWNFKTPMSLSINAWSVIPESKDKFGFISLTNLSFLLVIGTLLLLMYHLRTLSIGNEQLNVLLLLIGCSIVVFLYQIQPEYLFLLIPTILVRNMSIKGYVTTFALFPLSILQNTLYGFANSNQAYNSHAKSSLLSEIVTYLPILKLHEPHQFCAIVFSLTSVSAFYFALRAANTSLKFNRKVTDV